MSRHKQANICCMNDYIQHAKSQNAFDSEFLLNGTYEVEWEIPYNNIDGNALSFLYFPGELTIQSYSSIFGKAITATNPIDAISVICHLPGVVHSEQCGFLSYPEVIPLLRGRIRGTQKEILLPYAEVHCLFNTILIKAKNGFASLNSMPDWKENTLRDAFPMTENFAINLDDIKYDSTLQTASLFTTFSMDVKCPMNNLMEHYISPTQIIYSSLSGMLRHINRVTATLILPTEKHVFFPSHRRSYQEFT